MTYILVNNMKFKIISVNDMSPDINNYYVLEDEDGFIVCIDQHLLRQWDFKVDFS